MAPPQLRVHPEKPTLGIRASRPNELWHIDVTILKLLDGRKAYVHAVIDNWSRKILAWAVAESLNPATTCEVLVAAGRHLKRPGAETGGTATTPLADGPIVVTVHGPSKSFDIYTQEIEMARFAPPTPKT